MASANSGHELGKSDCPTLFDALRDSRSEALEIEHTFHPHGKPLTVRGLTYLTHAHMGNYRQALAGGSTDSVGNAMPPDVTQTRQQGRTAPSTASAYAWCAKRAASWVGRLSWSNGQNETWAFTKIDQSVHLGF